VISQGILGVDPSISGTNPAGAHDLALRWDPLVKNTYDSDSDTIYVVIMSNSSSYVEGFDTACSRSSGVANLIVKADIMSFADVTVLVAFRSADGFRVSNTAVVALAS